MPSRRSVFLSYRRQETSHFAGRLADRLSSQFGEAHVFMDVDSIAPGRDFGDAIERAVNECAVLLALIGPAWTIAVDAHGRRRLDDPNDLVVLELQAALARAIPVIPVLVDGANPPTHDDLPATLGALARRQALRIDHDTFPTDCAALLHHVTRIMAEASEQHTAVHTEGSDDNAHTIAEGDRAAAGLDRRPATKWRPRTLRVAAAVAAALAVTAGVIVAVAVSRPGTHPVTPPVAASTTTAPDTATIPDPATADPCSLLDTDSVKGFGATTLNPDRAAFAGCRANIARPDGGRVGFSIAFQNQNETARISGGTRWNEDGYTIVRSPPSKRVCEERILLADGNAVLMSTVNYDDPTGTTDLCAIADAGRTARLARLVRDGIGQRVPLSATSPLAGIPACSLLTPEEIAIAVVNAAKPLARFGDWGCDWNSVTSSDSVEVTYYRGYVLDEADGEPATFTGHPGTLLPQEGNCWAQFVQRSYSVGGSNRIESVWVTYRGSGNGDQLCRTATTLATAAAGRLPPPS